MAQLEEEDVVNNSAGEADKPPTSRSSQGTRAATKKVDNVSEEADEGTGKDEDSEEEEDEEEYEIEAILEAKRNMFKKGDHAFLVKWKGYGEEHNSWVAEKDAGNAQALINEFLRKKAKEKEQNSKLSARGRKPNSTKPAKNSQRGSPDDESVSVSTSKRGRRKAASSSDDEDQETTRKAKKSRVAASTNGSASAKRGTLASLNRTDDEDVTLGDTNGIIEESRPVTTMKDLKMASYKSWEEVVKGVSTVERTKGQLMIYFETTNGAYVREPSSICVKKFPLKLIQFYESHLRWRVIDDDVSEIP